MSTEKKPTQAKAAATPQPENVVYVERIGDREYRLPEETFDIFDDVTLWSENPRLIPHLDDAISTHGAHDEASLEQFLAGSSGYGALKKSIEDMGQMEAIYVWKRSDMKKYLVLEGSTRVTILRELSRAEKGTAADGSHRKVFAKVLPATFPVEHRVILLARIHVRGTGVRSWGRYVEAKFIYDATTGSNGQGPTLSISELANWMGKSASWVSRLRDAYTFALQFVTHIDSADVHRQAADNFSVLEEIIKSSGFGPRLKGGSPEAEKLRGEVFEMVSRNVFQEYRDARYMKEFYEDAEKWALLKTLEKGIAHRLANELKVGTSTAKSRINNLHDQIARAMATDEQSIGEAELEELNRCVKLVESRLSGDVGVFRLKARSFAQALADASLNDLLTLTHEDHRMLVAGFNDLEDRLKKRAPWWPKE